MYELLGLDFIWLTFILKALPRLMVLRSSVCCVCWEAQGDSIRCGEKILELLFVYLLKLLCFLKNFSICEFIMG